MTYIVEWTKQTGPSLTREGGKNQAKRTFESIESNKAGNINASGLTKQLEPLKKPNIEAAESQELNRRCVVKRSGAT